MFRIGLFLSSAAMLALVACQPMAASPPPPTAALSAPPAPTAPAATSAAGTSQVTASTRPPGTMPTAGQMPAGSYMRTIQDRGKLIAGVRQDVPLIGFLNPRTNQIEGFDVDFVKAITRAIFGDESKVELRPVTVAARIPSLQDGSVDLVAAAMTITGERKTQVDFSAVYYEAGQRVLVRTDSPYMSIQDLGGKRVCAAKGSTAEANIPRVQPSAEVVQADTYNECMLSLQQGRIDAISTDDVVLAGLATSDPSTKLVGPKFSSEPYGIGMGKGHPEFVGFVNGVIDQMKSDGRWKAAYDGWFGRFAGPAPEPPGSTYA
ncbi:MAG TPA: glutamate ABC transporter substrate-binding protein [Chloroflexota bacterium]